MIYTDASIGGPPRPAAAGAGFVIIFERDGVWESLPGARPLGMLRTPQEAEYHAAVWALRTAIRSGCSCLVVRTDSQLLVHQMNGQSEVFDVDLVPIKSKLRKLADLCDNASFEWVPRARNKTADRLADLGRRRNKGIAHAG